MSQPVPIPAELLEFIHSGSKFLIAGHKEPDGDCVGSELVLCSALRRLGKEAFPYSAGPFKRTEIIPYKERFTSAPSESEKAGAKVIVVDCSALERCGDLEEHLKGLPLAFIDHHAVGKHPEGTADSPVYTDPDAPATTFLIFNLIKALGLSFLKEEAELLFFGLCTDTGFFRHLDADKKETFAMAAELISCGASPKKTFQAINGGKHLNSRILLGRVLSSTESLFNGQLVICVEEYEDTRRFGLESRDSDTLYQLLQSVGGVEAMVVIRQETPDNCTVGFRSRDKVDVAAIAGALGGGGHKNAAGLSIPGTIGEIKQKIITLFEKAF